MIYWHIQMNQPWGRDEGSIKSINMLKEQEPIIGTGEWDDKQCENFKNALKIGDIILVREGKKILALCKITSDSFTNGTLNGKYHHRNFRKVEILDFYKGNEQFPKAQGTLGKLEIETTNSYQLINKYYKKVQQMNNTQKALDLLKYKKQIILQGPPGTGKTREAKIIARELIKFHSIENKIITYNTLTQDIIKSNIKEGQRIKGKDDTNYEVISFKKNIIQIKSDKSKVWKPSYNKIIESYNNQLFNEKGRTGGLKSYEDAIAKYLFENLDNKLIESQVETLYKEEDFLQVIQFHPSYSYEDFVRGIVVKPNSNGDGITYEAENKILAKFAENAENDPDNNYVLIIDEINRANLSSVLGELIYALEYRGEAVDSMYEVDGSNKITLPTNLYIIGTMNTADRSVGHIDYAIRRRFAFVDVLPRDLLSELGDKFDSKRLKEVEKLFDDHLSQEFKKEEVQLGHSYFITENIDIQTRLEHEIKPILREYVKDGVLKESASDEIEKL